MESTPNPVYAVGKKSIGPLMGRLSPDNIARLYHTMPHAWQRRTASWYPRYAAMVRRFADEHQVGQRGALGAFAILSSGASPETDFALMESAIRHMQYGDSLDGLPAKPLDLGKALSCLSTDDFGFVSGQKVESYLASLLGEENDPCMDRHAIAIALGMANQGDYKVTSKMYRDCQDAYRDAARQVGVTPRSLQEWTWTWRKAILDDAPGIVTNRSDLGELLDLRPYGWEN